LIKTFVIILFLIPLAGSDCDEIVRFIIFIKIEVIDLLFLIIEFLFKFFQGFTFPK